MPTGDYDSERQLLKDLDSCAEVKSTQGLANIDAMDGYKLAGGIIQILQDGRIIDPILHALASLMNEAGRVASVGAMYVIQTLINIIIPSGSAKAALTMPIMAPFSDVIGISRQATVMAFQFGDGFTNMITPTSAVLIGALGIARIPYEVWVKWFAKILLLFVVLGFLLLIPTVVMQLPGF